MGTIWMNGLQKKVRGPVTDAAIRKFARENGIDRFYALEPLEPGDFPLKGTVVVKPIDAEAFVPGVSLKWPLKVEKGRIEINV